MLRSTLSHILYSIDSNAKIGIFLQISLLSFLFLIFIEELCLLMQCQLDLSVKFSYIPCSNIVLGLYILDEIYH